MTLAQFAIAVGATSKWVQNATATLGLSLEYSEPEARQLALARVLGTTAGMPLKRAYDLAGKALASGAASGFVVAEASDGSAQVTVDLPRFLSTFKTRLAAARRHEPRKAGRPARPAADPLAAAREYGIDLSLLRSNLLRTPEERLRIAGRNAEFIRRLRGTAGR